MACEFAEVPLPAPTVTVVDVRSYGARGDGVTDDTRSFQSALAAAPSGATVSFPRPAAYYRVSAPLTVTKGLSLRGEGSEIRQLTANTTLFVINASNVHVSGLKLVGPQFTRYRAGETAIEASGSSAAAMLTGLRVEDNEVARWGGNAIYLKWVRDFTVSRNQLHDLYYAGVLVSSGQSGSIEANYVRNVVGVHSHDAAGSTHAYGVAVSRANSSSLVTDPRSSDITISQNIIEDIPGWEGLDTHGGERISFIGNTIRRTLVGINVGSSANAAGVDTFAPLDVSIVGNLIDSGTASGAANIGIAFYGALGRIGAPTEKATGRVTGNTVRGHGEAANSASGAIWVRTTQGLSVTDNLLLEPSPTGIVFLYDNYALSVRGNKITDPWTNSAAVGQAVGIYFRDDQNTGRVSATSVVRGKKVATYTLTSSLELAGNQSILVEPGPSRGVHGQRV